MSDVRIHHPIPGCHTWGIEYNYEPAQRVSYEADANIFVHASTNICIVSPPDTGSINADVTPIADAEGIADISSLSAGHRTQRLPVRKLLSMWPPK